MPNLFGAGAALRPKWLRFKVGKELRLPKGT